MNWGVFSTLLDMLEKLALQGVELDFLLEIILRSLIMFALVLLVLRLSGKRGVRQLTLFEVAIILSLGSAAGDPMFQEDIPILYGAVVLLAVIVVYKLIAWAATENETFHRLMEGSPVVIIRDGRFEVRENGKLLFDQREFLPELRNQSVEHLGQVRLGVLEVDGALSLLFYPQDEVRYGVPIFPDAYKSVTDLVPGLRYACMRCGLLKEVWEAERSGSRMSACARCGGPAWTKALNTKRNQV